MFMGGIDHQKWGGIDIITNSVYIYIGWWLTYLSEKYEFVSWDDDIANIWKVIKHVPNHQPVNNGL